MIFNKVKSGSPRVVLVHSKAKKKYSHGASEMQEVVAQAIKNLGKVKLSKEDLLNKESLKVSNYSPSRRGFRNSASEIPRIKGPFNNFKHFSKNILDIMSSPACQKEVVLAINFVFGSTCCLFSQSYNFSIRGLACC